MPNWCANSVEITGNEEDRAKLLKQVKTERSDFDFNAVIPIPKELEGTTSPADNSTEETKKINEELIRKYGYSDWYHWCIFNWGTKWWVDDVEVVDNEDFVTVFSFDTAWTPPIEVIKVLALTYPKLNFILRYFEPSCAFAGLVEAAGAMVYENYYEAGSDSYNKLAAYFGWDFEENVDETEEDN